MQVKIKLLYPDTVVPDYATELSAGFDLVANNFKRLYLTGNNNPFDCTEQVEGIEHDHNGKAIGIKLLPGARVLIGMGFAIALPEEYEMQVRPRSGLALKQGITVLNSPGTVDADYRDEVGVILINHSRDMVTISKGDRIAQGVIAKFEHTKFTLVNELNETSRNGGFGSTGI